MKRDLVPGIFRDEHAVVHRVGRAGRNQAHIHDRARRPRVALVDRIAVRIDLQRPVEVRSLLYRTLAVILDHAAPENGLAFVVGALQFEPGIVGIDGPTGEKVSDLLGAHHHIHANRVAAAQGRLHAIQRRGDGRDFTRRSRL